MNNEAKVLLGIGLVTLLVFVGGIMALLKDNSANQQPVAVDQSILVREDSHKIGAANPQVTLVEFGDFQCPYCADSHPAIQALIAKYPEQLLFVFRNYPLAGIHSHAQIAAEAAEAAGAQGKYWEMYDLIYKHQNDWADADDAEAMFADYAQQLELNMDEFNQALADHTYQAVVQQGVADGNALGVNSTPSFFVDGERFNGSVDQLQSLIDSKLAQ